MQPQFVVNIGPSMALLKKLRQKAADLTPLFEGPMTNRVHEMFARIFASEGGIIGRPWAPLSPATLEAKRRIGRGDMGILRRFNTLWASLTKRGHPLGYRIVTKRSLLIGTSVPYAASHQAGKGVPERTIVPSEDQIPAAIRAEWDQLMTTYLEEA